MLAVIIPALNEEETIVSVIRSTAEQLKRLNIQEFQVLVADNGSSDATAHLAQEAGATVIEAETRGYGSACLAGLAKNPYPDGIVCFLDADGADDPRDFEALLAPILAGDMDMVVGSRILGEHQGWVSPGALTPVQSWGNRLSGFLLSRTWGVSFTDLGPFRAITAKALQSLEMDDKNWGWTIQMQARAARQGLRVCEIPVHYRVRQGGQSKISGTLKGSIAAGVVILKTYAQSIFWCPNP